MDVKGMNHRDYKKRGPDHTKLEGLTFCPGPNMIDVSFPKDSASGNSQHSVLTPVITIYLLLIYPIFQFVIRWLIHFYTLTPHN